MSNISLRSLQRFSRISGFLYLIVIGAGLFAEAFVRQKMTIAGIRASEMYYRAGFVADLVNFICGLPVILFFWILFKRSHNYVVTLAIFFVIVSNAIFATNLLHQLQPLLIYGSPDYVNTFLPGQLAAMSAMALKMQSQGYAIGLVFFGFYCIIIGGLIYKTGVIPKLLGALYALAGVCYIINSFTMFLSPGFENPLFPYILFPSFIGELSVAVWLLFGGVRELKLTAD